MAVQQAAGQQGHRLNGVIPKQLQGSCRPQLGGGLQRAQLRPSEPAAVRAWFDAYVWH